jgi:hypothetical protein
MTIIILGSETFCSERGNLREHDVYWVSQMFLDQLDTSGIVFPPLL